MQGRHLLRWPCRPASRCPGVADKFSTKHVEKVQQADPNKLSHGPSAAGSLLKCAAGSLPFTRALGRASFVPSCCAAGGGGGGGGGSGGGDKSSAGNAPPFAETWTRATIDAFRTWFAHCTFVRNAKASQKQNEEQGLQVLAAAQEDFERRDHRKAPAAKEDFDCRDQQQEEECLYTDGSASQEEDEVEAAPRPPCRLEEAGAVSSESAFLQQDEPTHGVQRGREHLRHVCAQLHRASKLKTRHITRRECIVREREADGTLAVTNVQTVDSLADLSRRVSRDPFTKLRKLVLNLVAKGAPAPVPRARRIAASRGA